jgi:hypothetical protein
MSFTKDGQKHTLKGLKSSSSKIISSHHMEKLLKKGHSNIISQFNAIQVMETPHRKFTLIYNWSLLNINKVFETPHVAYPHHVVSMTMVFP